MDELISQRELEAKMREDEPPTVIDVRSREEFAEGHIPGAINIPVDDLKRRLADLPTGRAVCTYCSFRHPGQTRSERAAGILREAGFEAQALKGGITEWRASGRPVEEHEREKANG